MKMKKFNILVLSLILPICIFAQGYIKIKENLNVKVIINVKGEIFPAVGEYKFIFGKDTFDIAKTKYEKVESIDTSMLKTKLDYIKNINDTIYQINVTNLLNKKDTIKFVKSDGTIIPFFKIGIDSVPIINCGNKFRVIIPNKPSLVYYSSEIPKPNIVTPVNPQQPKGGSTKILSYLSWQNGLIAFTILALLIVIGFTVKNHVDEDPKYKKYEGGEFEDFARANKITMEKLVEMNEKLKDFEKLKSSDLNKLKNQLKGQELLVKCSKNHTEPGLKEQTPPQRIKPNELRKVIKYISKLQKTIDILSPKLNAEEQNEKLKSEIEKQTQEITRIGEEKKKADGDLIKITNTLSEKKSENDTLKKLNDEYSEKVVFVKFLKGYADNAFEYLLFCKSCCEKAIELFQNFNENSSENVLLVAQLLTKFYCKIPLDLGNWEEILLEIKENSTTSNPFLLRFFSRSENKIIPESQILEEFKKILFKKVYEKYISSLFILLEEFSNLSKFSARKDDEINEFENLFKDYADKLHSKTNDFGLTIRYVPLFIDPQPYNLITKGVAKQNCSLPYKNIKLEKDFVLEVISYGFDGESTKVILAK